ncbi:hypothetical protein HDG40_008061 [Paraburkholderia sp. JPY158]|uniref:Uncharacterized protein n=1 Tax=Paraburkholderia atlantica TaxID=2654982 RepID=A0A7W8QHE9_PARAM|nr:hypothetical protein [Paraburkholderia atlantica]MBB5429858.1 hypothetical protein [Paraburkholderia atlantica]
MMCGVRLTPGKGEVLLDRIGRFGPFGRDLVPKWISCKNRQVGVIETFLDITDGFGNDSLLRRMPLGLHVLYAVPELIGRPFPGRYDTCVNFGGPNLSSDDSYWKKTILLA